MPPRFVPTGDYPNLGEGSLSFSNLKTQFGDTYPVSLSEYYKSGGLTTDSASDYFLGLDGDPFPTSGKISMGVFHSPKPYWDQTFIPSGTGITTDYTITLPANTGYTHMACWIQGSGGSGMISNGLVSGWGNNQGAGGYSPAAGGNAGTFAIRRTTAISSGQTITVRVGAGGVPSSNGGGIVGNAYTYNSAGTTGSLGMNGDNINGQAGTTSYIKLDGANVLVVPGGARGVTNSRLTWVDEQQTPNTSTRYCEPPEPDGSNVIGADDFYVGGRGGMGISQYGAMDNTGYLQDMTWAQSSSEYGWGGATALTGFVSDVSGNPTYYVGDTIKGDGQKFHIGAGGAQMFASWTTGPGATRPDPHWYNRGITATCLGQYFGVGIYGYGGRGVAASNSSAALQTAKGGDAFARIMFYDQNLPYHTSGNAQLSPSSGTWT